MINYPIKIKNSYFITKIKFNENKMLINNIYSFSDNDYIIKIIGAINNLSLNKIIKFL